MSGVIVQDTRRSEMRIHINATGEPLDIRVAFSEVRGQPRNQKEETNPDKEETNPDFAMISIAGTDHKFLLEYEEGGSVLYVTPVEKDRERSNGK
jgi:hypothetical protein